MNKAERANYLLQVKKLRELAKIVIKQYPINVVSLSFVQYGENATFKMVDEKGQKYLLKLHRKIYHGKENLLEEHKWLYSLADTTEISVPKPVLTNDQYSLLTIPNTIAPHFIYADIFEWVEGHFVWKSVCPHHLTKLGVLMAILQKNGKSIKIRHRHYWHTEGLVGKKATLGSADELYDVSNADQREISAARRVVYQQLQRFEKAHPDKMGLIHADLHFGNFLINKQKVGIIDFDDCGTGFYGYDLAVPIFALEYLIEEVKNKKMSVLKEALYEGYSQHMPLTQEDLEMAPYFLAARKLAMLGWMQSRSSHPRLKAKLVAATKRVIKHLQRDIKY